MDTLAHTLMGIYAGRTDVYGQQKIRVSLDETTGQPVREATWTEIKSALTPAVIAQHLAGQITIGVYLLTAESRCAFAVWDIDSGDTSAVQLLMRVLRERGIEYLLTDSGRKGWHLTVAFGAPVSGAEAYAFARAIWEEAGRPERVECFPKQSVITPERPYGNLIKLPLGVHRATGRRCALLTDGFEPLIEGTERDEIAELARVPAATIAAISNTVAPVAATFSPGAGRLRAVTSSGFVPVPYPCFAGLATARYPDGARNILLFTLAKHLLNQGQPRAFAELVIERQADRCVADGGRTPAPYADWAGVVESVYSRGYTSFGCEEPAMRPFCQGEICPLYQRQHGTATSAALAATSTNPDPDGTPPPDSYTVTLEDLVQIGADEPEYEVSVCGRRISGLSVETLSSWRAFMRAVMGTLRFIPELPHVKGLRSEDVWRALVNEALATSVLEERPGNASSSADVLEAALGWLKHGTVSPERMDITRGALWDRQEADGSQWRYFLPRFVVQVIRGRTGPITQMQLYGILRKHGITGVNIKIDGSQMWCWRAPLAALERADL